MTTGRKLLPDRPTTPRGNVYLLHAEKPLGKAQHYIGWTESLPDRLHHHIRNQGAALVAAWNAAGINWILAKVWEGVTRRKEFQLKNWGKAREFCPICREAAGVTGKIEIIRGPNGHFKGSRRVCATR